MKDWLKKNCIVVVLFIVSLALFGYAIYALSQAKPPIVHTGTVTLEIRSTPDFTLAISPTTPILTFPDRVVPFSVTCTAVNQFAGDITITLSGLPTGVTAAFFPSATFTLGPDSPKGVQVNLTIPADEGLVGTHTITVTATSTTYN